MSLRRNLQIAKTEHQHSTHSICVHHNNAKLWPKEKLGINVNPRHQTADRGLTQGRHRNENHHATRHRKRDASGFGCDLSYPEEHATSQNSTFSHVHVAGEQTDNKKHGATLQYSTEQWHVRSIYRLIQTRYCTYICINAEPSSFQPRCLRLRRLWLLDNSHGCLSSVQNQCLRCIRVLSPCDSLFPRLRQHRTAPHQIATTVVIMTAPQPAPSTSPRQNIVAGEFRKTHTRNETFTRSISRDCCGRGGVKFRKSVFIPATRKLRDSYFDVRVVIYRPS